MRKESFADFSKRFYSRFTDPAIFDCGEVNLLKVAQDGLKVGYPWLAEFEMHHGKLDKAYFLRRMKARLRRISNPFANIDLAALAGREYLFLDNNRAVPDEDGNMVSLYFNRIVQSFDKEEYVLGLQSNRPSQLAYDFQSWEFQYYHFFLKVTPTHTALLDQIYETLQYVKEHGEFTREEEMQIQGAFYLYWVSFRVWDHVLSQLKPKRVIFIQHYHNEGLLMAMRHHGIESRELQHGLIAKEDIFYVYPEVIAPVRDRALFAEKILTYGPYWTNVLLQGFEYPKETIEELGYYVYNKSGSNPEFQAEIKALGDADTRFLLITGQYRIYQYFNDYIQWLSKDMEAKGQNAIILYKPHPNCEPETYKEVGELSNVQIVSAELTDLFHVSDLHLSIYSTTLYEAVRFDLENYTLYVPACSDYVDGILRAGIATKVELEQNPFSLEGGVQPKAHPAEHYFAPFRPEILKKKAE